ncbi:MAG TPA: pitrilysin family protein [Chloroflexia bacterium]|nr:pitrilysin family protein [Chloroflexia bacterium]
MKVTKARAVDTDQSIYEKTTLPNGIRVITATMPHTRSAAVSFYIGVGARHEAPKLAGVSHFVEHMVFKGTRRRPNPAQISEDIEGVGGNLNAATDHEHTNYRALVPYNYLHTAVDVLSDMLRDSEFKPEEVVKERDVILEEIDSTQDSPGDIADLAFDALLWPGHALGKDVAGTKTSVKRITREDLVTHIEKQYQPNAIVVSVAGNVSHTEVVDQIGSLWTDMPRSANGKHHIEVPPQVEVGPKTTFFKKRTEQVNLLLGVPALPYTHDGRYVQDVLDSLLGAGMSSRLFVEIRENRGLAYAVSSFVKTYADVGAFGVHAAVDNERVDETIRAIIDELGRIKRERVPEIELRKVKEYIKGNTLLSLERSTYVAHWGGWQELQLGRIEPMDEVLDKIENVTAEQVQALANELFTTEHLHLALVGPARDTSVLQDLLVVN